MKLFGLISLCLCLSFGKYGCETNPAQPSGDFDIQNLFQSWSNTYEEEQPDALIRLFRSGDPDGFAPSRFRMRYVFSESGDCEWLFLNPIDAHYMKPATWKVAPNDNHVILIYDTDGGLLKNVSFKIIELEKDVLQIAPIDF